MTTTNMQAELDESIRRFRTAWADGDASALLVLLSPTYTYVDLDGSVQDRAAWLAYAPGRAALFKNRVAFTDTQTRIVGDVAVIIGRTDIEGLGDSLANGRISASVRFTEVWIRRDGNWLREAFQATFM